VIGRYLAGTEDFADLWNRFLDRGSEHRETRLLRKDGKTIIVEYSAKANYVPGRHVVVFRDITRKTLTEEALRESEERFQQMASNIQEVFWMLDAQSKKVIYVNQAYETLTGRSHELFREDPKVAEDIIHPEDRVRVLSRLDEAVRTGHFDEEFRIVRPGDASGWVWIRGFPVRDSDGTIRRLVGTALDISARKAAEESIAHGLDLAESARAEADALRKITLALTQDLSMDYVLDTLLQSLLSLIPCESAKVLLVEAGTRLFLAREVQGGDGAVRLPKSPNIMDAKDNRLLLEVLASKQSVLISETASETGWTAFREFSQLRSWLCAPLVASQQVIGVLSLGHTRPQALTPEHLRLANSLAIPASVAIQNARLYERAEIFRAELEHRLADLETS